jgi:hypothetical protein
MQNIIARSLLVPIILPLLMSGAGCDSSGSSKDTGKPTPIHRDQITQLDRWAVESPGRASASAAVVRQCTLFEYHFNDGQETLTPIGRRDASLLARHFRGEDWVLSVRQGGADDALYHARVMRVEQLIDSIAGDGGAVTIVDAEPGGAGLASDDARRIRRDSLKGANSLRGSRGGEELVQPIDTPLEGGS